MLVTGRKELMRKQYAQQCAGRVRREGLLQLCTDFCRINLINIVHFSTPMCPHMTYSYTEAHYPVFPQYRSAHMGCEEYR